MSGIIQGSPEWFAIRRGKVTASRVADIIARTKSGYSTSRENYAAQLVAERLTGNVEQGFTNAAMQWGTEKEPEARSAYEFLRDATVMQIGFVIHPEIAMAGASPDGLIGDDGMIEIKCPNTATHIDTLLGAPVQSKYITQMQWQMACTGRQWCEFASYDPRLPPEMQFFSTRIVRDTDLIDSLEKEVRVFLAEIEKTVAQLRAAYAREAA